ncbi:hypothetical protein JQ615_41640 [Bradyrhizobium jicamae]|uniref:Uncharacterized protein n=1 Tax=Bradyrhizobium jicamae TaxID=280332 RepID=A0ABS5FYI1_9BRAD|nr:hypothetical protein [Bradyrhizobium jicamae]MBR0801837.1 hypothetical protein [Bradyrhizobium jicamae]
MGTWTSRPNAVDGRPVPDCPDARILATYSDGVRRLLPLGSERVSGNIPVSNGAGIQTLLFFIKVDFTFIIWVKIMIGVFGIASVAAGSALAWSANWDRSKAEILEACAGTLLIVSLASVGAALPDGISELVPILARCGCEGVHH